MGYPLLEGLRKGNVLNYIKGDTVCAVNNAVEKEVKHGIVISYRSSDLLANEKQ